jgi:hypothetical protein
MASSAGRAKLSPCLRAVAALVAVAVLVGSALAQDARARTTTVYASNDAPDVTFERVSRKTIEGGWAGEPANMSRVLPPNSGKLLVSRMASISYEGDISGEARFRADLPGGRTALLDMSWANPFWSKNSASCRVIDGQSGVELSEYDCKVDGDISGLSSNEVMYRISSAW